MNTPKELQTRSQKMNIPKEAKSFKILKPQLNVMNGHDEQRRRSLDMMSRLKKTFENIMNRLDETQTHNEQKRSLELQDP